jgi:hypothetical protein
MTVLVAYATRHGSTTGIAERIAAGLRAAGLEVEALPVGEVRSVDGYEGVVVGGAAYMFHWLREATEFVHRHSTALGQRPVGLGERLLRLMPKARASMPVGDFREWPEIDAWAAEVAAALLDARGV